MKVPPPTTTRGMSNSIFVYGTLMSPQVVQVLLGRIPKSIPSPCRLCGHSRHPVKNHIYPGMIPTANSHVDGMIWLDLSDWEMKAFDFFEDVDYQRRQVQISILPKIATQTTSEDSKVSEKVRQVDEIVHTDAYIWTNPLSELQLQEEWSYENFCKEHLDWYLSNTVELCRRGLDRLKQQEES
jgi:gamma-glutamylcyclotransferase (GGCT)/AIG2-like uncharacterized protein YtfP